MVTTTPEDLRQMELNWAEHLVDDEAVPLWRRLTYSSRMHCFLDKTLIVWRQEDERVEVLDQFKLQDISLSAESGPEAHLVGLDGERIKLSTQPVQIADYPLFVWLPAFFEARYAPLNWHRADSPRTLRIPLNFKQTARFGSSHHRTGSIFIDELHRFKEQHPEHAETWF